MQDTRHGGDNTTDYEQGAADAFALIMRAFQECAPEPHHDPAEPTPEVLRMEKMILQVLQDVAARRLTLFDPGDLHGTGFDDEARDKAGGVQDRHRTLARAILRDYGGDDG